MKPIEVFEMFAGYGGASWGLKKAEIPFECVGISEIDKYAVQCFNTNFPNTKNFGDCSKINTDELPDFDLLTGGFPCQDVSIAGNRSLDGGRTNLYSEILRIAKAKKPKFMLLENVKGLLSMEVDERKLHLKIVSDLNKIGYDVCWKVLNSKDYGIPQNRERIWFVCKLGQWDFMEFQFPEPIELKIFLKDILEKEVDKKYYLSEEQITKLIKRNENFNMKGNRFIDSNKEFFSGLTCNQNCNDVLMLNQKTRDVNQAINIAQEIADNEDKPVQLDLMHLQHGEIRPLSTYIPQDLNVHRCLQAGEPKEVLISPKEIWCLEGEKNSFEFHNQSIRKLTPIECFRLMGFLDDEIKLEGLSDTQRYKLAGNGWDINLVSKIFRKMFDDYNEKLKEELFEQVHNENDLNVIDKLSKEVLGE